MDLCGDVLLEKVNFLIQLLYLDCLSVIRRLIGFQTLFGELFRLLHVRLFLIDVLLAGIEITHLFLTGLQLPYQLLVYLLTPALVVLYLRLS